MSRRAVSANGRAANGGQGIPEATIARLPVYLRVLYAFAEQDIADRVQRGTRGRGGG